MVTTFAKWNYSLSARRGQWFFSPPPPPPRPPPPPPPPPPRPSHPPPHPPPPPPPPPSPPRPAASPAATPRPRLRSGARWRRPRHRLLPPGPQFAPSSALSKLSSRRSVMRLLTVLGSRYAASEPSRSGIARCAPAESRVQEPRSTIPFLRTGKLLHKKLNETR